MQKWPGCRDVEMTPEAWERRMGFPAGWTDVAWPLSATPSYPTSPNGLDERSERHARRIDWLIALAPQLYATPELARQWQQALRDRRDPTQPRLWETDRSQGAG
jgi:hypothetical protein